MHDTHEFLRSLAVVLAVAAITTVIFQRLRQPVVLGYLIAGLIVGPHVPVPIVASTEIVQTLSELGVILLMFSLGLEFHLAKLLRVGPAAGFTAVIQSSFMAWLGFLAGQMLGWTILESVFTAAIVAISSTTIIAKAFDEQGVRGRLRELVVGVLLIEDLIAIVFMAVLTAVATGAGLSASALGATVGKLVLFLAVLLAAGMLTVPRFIRFVTRLGRSETTLVASVGICFAIAYIAQAFGYSVALGAFIAGSLVAESGKGEEIETLVHPVRDVFGAVFFVSVGMLIDPALVAQHWSAVAALTMLVIVGKVMAVSFGAFVAGVGTKTAVQAGMSLAQIGEFSFIIAGLGLSLGATGQFLYPVAVAVSGITTLTTPWLIRAAAPVAEFVDRKLPRPLQTFAALYGAWLERLRATGAASRTGIGHQVRRYVRLVILDVVVLSALIIGVSLGFGSMTRALSGALGFSPAVIQGLVVAIAVAAALPLVLGVGRLTRRLGDILAEAALPRSAGKVDLERASRRTLSITLQLGITFVAGIVVLATTQIFLPHYSGPIVLLLVLAGFAVAFWRSVRDLEGHVRAGAQAVVAALGKYARGSGPHASPGHGSGQGGSLDELNRMLPGLGAPVALHIGASSYGVGKTLAELNLRGRTGATVLAISRDGAAIAVPGAEEKVLAGDVLALAGTHDAVAAARELLTN